MAPLLSLVLIGLPELEERLRLYKNRSLWSRIHTRLRLGEAKPEDTAEYLRHRLEAAGATTELFDSEAIALLHEATEWRLREIDRIGTEALRIGARKKLKRIDRHVITAVAGGLDSDDD